METTTQALERRPEPQQAIEALSVADLAGHVQLIRQAMAGVMRDGEHYGTIPGCGDKKTLLLPGAQTLCLMFRLAPRYAEHERDLGRGHREYKVNCSLTNARGDFVGEGVGSCSTMESKYRYRSERTNKEVPHEYWKTRNTELLGGSQYRVKKLGKEWCVVEQVEYENPADYYNTVLKMAKKRAFVDAILTRTAASDIFTQDVEEIKENEAALGHQEQPEATKSTSATTTPPSATPELIQPTMWKDCVLHFGKNKGKRLGELESNQLSWYINEWEPKEHPPDSGKYSKEDLLLRKMLNFAQEVLYPSDTPQSIDDQPPF